MSHSLGFFREYFWNSREFHNDNKNWKSNNKKIDKMRKS